MVHWLFIERPGLDVAYLTFQHFIGQSSVIWLQTNHRRLGNVVKHTDTWGALIASSTTPKDITNNELGILCLKSSECYKHAPPSLEEADGLKDEVQDALTAYKPN